MYTKLLVLAHNAKFNWNLLRSFREYTCGQMQAAQDVPSRMIKHNDHQRRL